MLKWDEMQMFIYGRRLMTKTARQFINSESGLTSWKALRDAMLDEFSVKMTSAAVYEMRRTRKKKSGETYLQYVYAMQSIAKKTRIEEEALVEFIIAGINDDSMNKAVLYAASKITDLKKKLEQYEKMKKQVATKRTFTKPIRIEKGPTTNDHDRKEI